jgi:hypothetical protein
MSCNAPKGNRRSAVRSNNNSRKKLFEAAPSTRSDMPVHTHLEQLVIGEEVKPREQRTLGLQKRVKTTLDLLQLHT